MTNHLAPKLESIISGHGVNEDDADWLRSLLSRLDELEKDAARLDYLESEFDREGAWLASDRSTRMPQTLFRSNLPITRAAIDSAIAKGA